MYCIVSLSLFLFSSSCSGGAYNVLLNTTSKSTAAIAACLTILSYVATAVVSGAEAIDYAAHLWVS